MNLQMKTDDRFLLQLGFAIEVFEAFCKRCESQLDYSAKEFLPDFVLSGLMVQSENIDGGDLIGWADAHLTSTLEHFIGCKATEDE